MLAARRPLGWSDSVEVDALPDPAGSTLEAPLVRLRGLVVPGTRSRTRAVVSLGQGTDAWDESSLAVERRDSASTWRAEVMSGSRGVTQALGDGGRRLWGLSGRIARGAQRWSADYTQRGAAGHLPLGLEQSAAGESGSLTWRYARGAAWAELGAARGNDHHESAGDTLPWSRRDAGATRLEATLGGALLGGESRIIAGWRDERVARTPSDRPGFERRARTVWVAGAHRRGLGRGRLEASLGGGYHDGVSRAVIVPWMAWCLPLASGEARIAAGRWTRPQWADLAIGQGPFLQDTWAAGAQWAGADAGAGRWRAQLLALAGRAGDAALVRRVPLEELWLRPGSRASDRAVRFVLAAGGGEVGVGSWHAGLAGWANGADDAGVARVDPRWGARAGFGWTGSRFGGDLMLAPRLFVEALGARQADTPARTVIAAYVTLGISCALTIADATVIVEGRNLEDRVRDEPWVDPSTGVPARGGGRQLRLLLRWMLYN